MSDILIFMAPIEKGIKQFVLLGKHVYYHIIIVNIIWKIKQNCEKTFFVS